RCLLRRGSVAPMVGCSGRPGDLDRVVDQASTACAAQPSMRERRQPGGMSRTDPHAFTGLRHASAPRPAGGWVTRPPDGLTPARILNPPRGSEDRAHRSGVAIPVAGGATYRRTDTKKRVPDDCIAAVRRSMAPDDRRVTCALGTGKTGVDDLEQVSHRS